MVSIWVAEKSHLVSVTNEEYGVHHNASNWTS